MGAVHLHNLPRCSTRNTLQGPLATITFMDTHKVMPDPHGAQSFLQVQAEVAGGYLGLFYLKTRHFNWEPQRCQEGSSNGKWGPNTQRAALGIPT